MARAGCCQSPSPLQVTPKPAGINLTHLFPAKPHPRASLRWVFLVVLLRKPTGILPPFQGCQFLLLLKSLFIITSASLLSHFLHSHFIPLHQSPKHPLISHGTVYIFQELSPPVGFPALVLGSSRSALNGDLPYITTACHVRLHVARPWLQKLDSFRRHCQHSCLLGAQAVKEFTPE